VGYEDSDDYLLLSGIQHFNFCRRRWALIYIENVWADNERTIRGELFHEHAHNPFFNEKRGDLILTREMPIFSRTMGVTGHCDIVEFRRDGTGVCLAGREGTWLPCPVEYKRGQSMKNDADRLQLCAQAMCLEEMLACPPIAAAYMYYGETKRRETVALDEDLRGRVRGSF
jgi:CRISPR-associated exonuclease Cas4